MLRVRGFLLAVGILALAAALTQHGLLRVGGVAPNLVITTLVVMSLYMQDVIMYCWLVLCASILVRSTPVFFEPLVFVTALVALLLYVVQRRIVWPGVTAVIILTSLATLGTYALLEPAFLWQQPGLLFFEVVYNVGIGLLLFEGTRFMLRRFSGSISL